RHRHRIGASELLERPELVRRGQSTTIDPEALVVPGRLDVERVAFPPADRVTVERRREIGGMRAAIHVDHSIRMRSANVEDEDLLQFSELHELDTVRCQELANTAGRLAARVRL